MLGGEELSRCCLIKRLCDRVGPDLLILSSPGLASILIFRSTSASMLRLVDEVDDEKCSRSIAYLSDMIKSDCPSVETLHYDTRISLDKVLQQCSKTLMLLLAEISPALDSSLTGAMIGHIITSVLKGHTTNLQLSLSVLMNH